MKRTPLQCLDHGFKSDDAAAMQEHLYRYHDALPTVAAAGRKGGKRVAERLGHDHFVKIGKLGGARVKRAFEALRAEDEEGGSR